MQNFQEVRVTRFKLYGLEPVIFSLYLVKGSRGVYLKNLRKKSEQLSMSKIKEKKINVRGEKKIDVGKSHFLKTV